MALRWAKALREAGIPTEVYPEPTKMKRQMSYADQKHIPYVAIIGGDELSQEKVMLKNMTTGEQQLISLEQLVTTIQ
jgi:histidyl-tRNA synthetase